MMMLVMGMKTIRVRVMRREILLVRLIVKVVVPALMVTVMASVIVAMMVIMMLLVVVNVRERMIMFR